MTDAIRLAERGWPVFPCGGEDGKRPLTDHGFKDGTTKPRLINAWWRAWPDATIGVALPEPIIGVDVDDRDAFAASGLALPATPLRQLTPRGGEHDLYRLTRGAPQTVKTHPGVDTRVGGRGYLIAWQPEAWLVAPSELPDAPEWVYEEGDGQPLRVRRVRGGQPVEVATFKIGERDDALTSFAGSMRRAGAGPDAIFAALKAMLDSGQIEQGQSRADKITERDLRRIAGSIGGRESEAVERQRPRPRRAPARHFAADLLLKDLRPLEYLVDVILPEGLGVIAGAPKVGKSWLTFQTAVEIATGGEVLGHQVDEPRPVLYYGLEDGERRFKSRLEQIIGGRALDISLLELRYEAPVISEGFEEEVSEWLDANERGAVFLDVLAKVRPASRGKGNAYDEDYAVIGPLQKITKDRPGSALAVVTHDRKAGSEDFLTTVTGTRGVTGAADWIWVVKRDRLKVEGSIFVTGRDVERDVSVEAKFAGVWVAAPAKRHGRSAKQDDTLDALRTEGDMTAGQVADYLHPDEAGSAARRNAYSVKLNALVRQGLVAKAGYHSAPGGGVVFHVISEDERRAAMEEAMREAAEVTAARAIPVRRTSGARALDGARGPARENTRPQSPQPPHQTLESVEGVGGEGSSLVRGGARGGARARTRVRLLENELEKSTTADKTSEIFAPPLDEARSRRARERKLS